MFSGFLFANMTKHSIEFAHIYLNQSIGHEHKRSAGLYKELKDHLAAKGDIVESFVLIDDYNATEKILEPERLVRVLGKLGVQPDYVAYESQLTIIGEDVLRKSDGPEKDSSARFASTNGKLPCSLLIVAWYLVRLGIVAPPKALFDWELSICKQFEPAEYLVNILPDYYKGVENRACALLGEGPYGDAALRVTNNYFSS